MIYSDNRKYVQTPWRVTFDKKKFDKEVAVKTFLIDLKHEELRYLNRDTKTVQLQHQHRKLDFSNTRKK